MDKARIIPPDPMEVEQLPVDEVDPANETELDPGDSSSPVSDDQHEPRYVENEGLDGAPTQPRRDIERPSVS